MRTLALLLVACPACSSCAHRSLDPRLPLTEVRDAPLPGGATRFDYQDVDLDRGLLVIAHMNDGTVLVVSLADQSVLAEIPGVPTARGVVVAPEIGRFFVTSSPDQVVAVDEDTLQEVDRFTTGAAPDGIGWDPADRVIGVSDQGDGALSLLADAGSGARTDVPLGEETGNVVFDASRGWFWITAVQSDGPDQLVAVNPTSGAVEASIDVAGCEGAHGLRLHPNGESAFIACEGNDKLARVDLEADHSVDTDGTGSGPDVLALDPEYGFLYVSAESGTLTVFDLNAAGLRRLDRESPGPNSHTVAVDPATHRVFFPLEAGDDGTPVLRVMQPGP